MKSAWVPTDTVLSDDKVLIRALVRSHVFPGPRFQLCTVGDLVQRSRDIYFDASQEKGVGGRVDKGDKALKASCIQMCASVFTFTIFKKKKMKITFPSNAGF